MVAIGSTILNKMADFPEKRPKLEKGVKYTGLAVGIISTVALLSCFVPQISGTVHAATLAIHIPPIYPSMVGMATFGVCKACEKLKEKREGRKDLLEPDTLVRTF